MYLHIGNGESIHTDRIIGIFDLDTATVSSLTKGYISHEEKKGNIEYTDADLPRSFLLYEEKRKKYKIKLSRISTLSLTQRAEEKEEDTEY